MRLRIRVARPMARGRKRLSVGPSSACTGGDPQLLADQLVVVLRVGDRGLEQLEPRLGGRARREGQDGPRLGDVLAADVVAHQPRLAGGGAHVARLRACTSTPGSGVRRRSRLRPAAFSAASLTSLLGAGGGRLRRRPRARCPPGCARPSARARAWASPRSPRRRPCRRRSPRRPGPRPRARPSSRGCASASPRAAASAFGLGGLPWPPAPPRRPCASSGLPCCGFFGLVGAHRTRPFESCPR